MPETLIEAELFGHEAGAFTGATKARPGRFEEANGGTLFLDELATLSSPAQDRLLRAIEYGEVTRIGSSRPLQVDVRIVAATNEHLPRLVEREPLPRRPARPAVASRSSPCRRCATGRATFRCSPTISAAAWRWSSRWDVWPGFSDEAMAQLQAYDWPGNVRELRNVVERAVYRWAGQEGPIEDIQFDPFESPWRPLRRRSGERRAATPRRRRRARRRRRPKRRPPPAAPAHDPDDCADFRLAVAEYEKAILAAALEKCRWNQRAAATALSLTYDQLRHAMRRHELQG